MVDPPPRGAEARRWVVSVAGARKWLGGHLSAAVVLMIAAGGLIWANVRERKIISPSSFIGPSFYQLEGLHGWPWHALRVNPNIDNSKRGNIVYDSSMIVWDAMAAIAILFAVWFVCEWLIRHRAARKGT